MLSLDMQLALVCPDCGFDNPRGWSACARCGAALGRSRAASDTGDAATAVMADPRRAAPARGQGAGPPAAQSRASDARPLLGQAHAVGRVRRAVERALREGRPTLLVLEGEAGSGRTRILHRASEIAASIHREVRVLYGARRRADDGPYAPFARLLRDRFDVTPSDAPSEVRAHIGSVVGRALDTTDMARVAETSHLVGYVAGIPFPESPFLTTSEGDPLALSRRAAAAMQRFFEGEAGERPLLVLLDDMTDADDEAWGLLDALLEAKAPIAIVMTGEAPLADRAVALFASEAVDSARLVPLSAPEVEELVRSKLPSLVELPAALLDALVHRTRGNPTKLEALLTALVDGGLFHTTERGLEVRIERLERGDLPLTMADAIRARLQRLSEGERRLMEHAAVVGEVFWDGALLALERTRQPLPDPALPPLAIWPSDDDARALERTLEALEEKRFIVRIASSATAGLGEFTFQYAGTRSVIYEDSSEAARALAHGVVARWLSATQGPALENRSAVLAPHLERAGLSERAAEVYLEAAAEARRQLRTTMALRYVDRALGLVGAENVARRIAAVHERGSLLTVLGRYDEAHAAFAEMLRLAWSLGARGRAGAALNRIARIHRERGEHAEALAHLERALELFRSSDDQRGVASTFDDIAQVHRLLGRLDPALAAAEAALDIRASTKDERGQAVSLNTIGYIELDRGTFDDAETRFTRALHIRVSLGDHEGAIQTRIALGRLAFLRGETSDAIQIWTDALQGAREMDYTRFQAYLLSHLGEAHLARDALDEASASLEEARALAEGMRDQRALADIERRVGLVQLRRGDGGAGATLERALALALQYGMPESIALAHRSIGRLRAKVLFDSGRKAGEDAETSFRECIRVFHESGNRHQEARAQAELGMHLIEKGDREGAREALGRARDAMQTLRLPELPKVRETLSQL